MKARLFIDGENFIYKVEDSLIKQGINKHKISTENIDLKKLIKFALPDIKLDNSNYYSAKLQFHKESPAKSKELILRQRILKTNLEKQGFNFILAGNVRPQIIKVDGKSKTIFKEKGVDVRIAVDMVALSCDKSIDIAILCSSDSDLQPAVAEIRKRGIEVIYLGFENNPNKGLTYTTNRTILFRNSEIAQVVPLVK
ncbi:MAG TPA: NYN domain-containing protein [Candidatus Saccharimonadales bacterium]|nr:NYN domain-containing protein [Candidatus Saccharimonadales bacterium]